MGGLSESVVKRSSTALLRWVRACKSAGGLKAVTGLGMRLVGMFGEANGDARVVVPLLKTLEVRCRVLLRAMQAMTQAVLRKRVACATCGLLICDAA